MKVGNDSFRRCVCQGEQLSGCCGEQLKGGGAGLVTEMLTEDGLLARCEAEGGLEIATDCEHARALVKELQGTRSMAAGKPNRHRQPSDTPHHRVIAGRMDRPVVHQKAVSDRAEAFGSQHIVSGDRFTREVATGHHQHL